jgi:hypothetical protein
MYLTLRYLAHPLCLVISVVALSAVCGVSQNAAGSEFGVSTYRPGLMDLFAGYLGPPGSLNIKDMFLYQDATARVVLEGPRIETHVHTVTFTNALFAAYVTKIRFLGTYWAAGIIPQVRLAEQSLREHPIGQSNSTQQASSVAGLGDLIVIPWLGTWNYGQFHVAAGLAMYAPTGNYDRDRIINIGDNRWAIEPDVGVTWMDQKGREISIFAGYTVNSKNTSTHYRSGDEFHADFALAKHFSGGSILGVAGYALQQTTADSGTGAILGPYRGRVIAIGPIIGRTVTIIEHPVTFTAKYAVEFDSQNRSSGNELWISASCRFN